MAGRATPIHPRVRGTQASLTGVGYSQNPASRTAGTEAAREALERAGAGACSLALVFCTSKHDPSAVLGGVRSVVGEGARIAGGAAIGVITNDRLGYEGHQVGVAVLDSAGVKVDLLGAGGLPDREREVGETLGRKILAGAWEGDPSVLLLYDMVKEKMADGLSMNLATPLLAGMEKGLGGSWPPLAGAGLIGDLHWNASFQFMDGEVLDQTALGVVFHGDVRMDTTIVRGCRPSSGYHTVTKSDGHVVLELDGRPTADVVSELMGRDSDESQWADYPIFITLGVNRGDKFGEYREDDYAVRLCMGVDTERRGLAFFGDDLVPGTEVQLMRRAIDFEYLAERTDALFRGLEGRRPLLGLYIDCGGRAPSMSGMDADEAEEMQRAVGDRVPLLGWYVGCEIGRAGDVMDSHNWSGILCVLSEPEEAAHVQSKEEDR